MGDLEKVELAIIIEIHEENQNHVLGIVESCIQFGSEKLISLRSF
jgi:hypothetical protein